MGYTCKNYRAAGNLGTHSPGMVVADLYREDGNIYRTAAMVADCGSLSAAMSYASQKNNELKAAETAARELVADVLTMVTRPTTDADQDEAESDKVADTVDVEQSSQQCSTPIVDPDELKKAAKYALKVFEGHCNSNLHSLGCACALSWLKQVLGESLTVEDKRNLQSINVHVPK